MNKLEAIQISKSYSNHKALSDIHLNIPCGSIFGLLGPNGAGKTTLIRIINQIIAADRGKILINGRELEPDHIRIIGYLPEERGLYKKMRVGEQLIYLAQLKGMNKHDSTRIIKEWLKKFDILTWWHKNIEDLSKGMQQKVQFIATVVHNPELIILDEPFSGFDPVNANLIKDEIFELREKGATIIFSTHRMESVEELCDHIALINKSRKILDGPKTNIKNEYRNNIFLVEHFGPLQVLNGGYNVLDQVTLAENYFRTTVQANKAIKPNDLLSELISQVEIYSFMEKIPSINEIFITKVQEKLDE